MRYHSWKRTANKMKRCKYCGLEIKRRHDGPIPGCNDLPRQHDLYRMNPRPKGKRLYLDP